MSKICSEEQAFGIGAIVFSLAAAVAITGVTYLMVQLSDYHDAKRDARYKAWYSSCLERGGQIKEEMWHNGERVPVACEGIKR